MTHDVIASPVLIVESGVHRFARSDVPMGASLVGAGTENAIVVSDHSAPIGFRLERSGDDGLILLAVDASLDMSGKVLRSGQQQRCVKSLGFRSGGIEFRLQIPESSARNSIRCSRARAISYAGAFAGGVISALGLTIAASLHASPVMKIPAVSFETTGSIAAASTPEGLATAKGDDPAKTVLDGLRRQITAAGLDAISFDARSDGAIEASGKIRPNQNAAWREVGRWFDTAAKGRTVLVDNVQLSADAPSLQIQAVWSGRNPYVVDGSGEKLFIGSTLSSGWSIHGIDAKRVLIKRGEQIVAVRF